MRKFRPITTPLIMLALILTLVIPASAGGGTNLPNPGFEDGLTGWTLTGNAGDKVVCQGDKNHNDHVGLCGFLFKGNADSSAVLKVQPLTNFIDIVNSNLSGNAGGLTYGVWRYSKSALSKMSIKMVVTTNGSPITSKITPNGATSFTPNVYEWWQAQWNVSIAQGTVVSKIVLKVTDRSTTGKQWIDDAYLHFTF